MENVIRVLEELEDEANRIVWANVPVQEAFPSPEKRNEMDYRSKKELTGDVRIITIPGADVCACCGTHVENTGEVGMIKVTGMIHYKGGVRISILCGRKAVLDYRRRVHQDGKISSLLSAKENQLSEAVERLKEENAGLQGRLAQLRREYFQMKTESLPKKSGPLALAQDGLDPAALRQLATMLFRQGRGDTVLVISENGQTGSFFYVIGSDKQDVRPLGKELNRILNGRGGGSAQMVQGTFEKNAEEIIKEFMQEAGKGRPE